MRLFRSTLACALSFGLLIGPGRATAEGKKDAQLEEARVHAQKAKVHYDLGEYQQAAEEYIAVYRIKATPQLLFNIAQAYRQASQYEKAKQFYRAYLRESGGAVKNKAAVDRAIKEIDELLAKEKKTRDAPPTGIARQPIPQPPPALPEKQPEETPKAIAQKPAQGSATPLAEMVKPATDKQPAASPKPVEPAPVQKQDKSVPVAVASPAVSKPAPPAAVTARPAAQAVVEERSSPFYKKWWFWTAVGVVAVGGGVAAASAGGGNAAPASHFGTAKVF